MTEGAIMRPAPPQGNTGQPLDADVLVLSVAASAPACGGRRSQSRFQSSPADHARSAHALLRIAFIGLMTPDDTAGDRADLAVPSHFAGNSTDQCAFDAAFGIRRARRERHAQHDADTDQKAS